MSYLKTLTDINDCKYLLDLYHKQLPSSAHGYYTLKNFVNWFELNPDIDHVRVYVLENWKASGFFIILDYYQLFINTLHFNEDEIKSALKLLDWRREYKIFALPAVLYPVVEEILKTVLKVNMRVGTLKIYQREASSIKMEYIKVPEFLVLRPLSITDANIINDEWYSKQEGSLEFIQALIKYNTNFGLYTKDTNELVAWCTRCQSGFLGTLHVRKEFRGQGLATLLIEAFTQKLLELGEDVRTLISNSNIVSQKLFDKLGFKPLEDVLIVYNKNT